MTEKTENKELEKLKAQLAEANEKAAAAEKERDEANAKAAAANAEAEKAKSQKQEAVIATKSIANAERAKDPAKKVAVVGLLEHGAWDRHGKIGKGETVEINIEDAELLLERCHVAEPGSPHARKAQKEVAEAEAAAKQSDNVVRAGGRRK